jgi:hypothetical protein
MMIWKVMSANVNMVQMNAGIIPLKGWGMAEKMTHTPNASINTD